MESMDVLKNGILTGFYELDNLINGLNKSELIVIASRPAMGKSTLALNIAANVATDEKIPVALFNLELSKEQCIERMIAQKSLVNINKVKTNNVNDDESNQVKTTIIELADAPIYIDDTPSISIQELREKSFKLKEEKNIGLVLIDYLQLINDSEDENICTSLKNLAIELDVPVIVTSQLTTEIDKREDKRPRLSDVNSVVEQESDVVMFLYSEDNNREIIVAKNRYGNIGTIKL